MHLVKLYKTNMSKINKPPRLMKIKTEFKEEIDDDKSKITIQDINKFRFEKKPHVKIEYDIVPSSDLKDNIGLWQPKNWKDFLLNLKNMRANNDAPVDSMGCHMSKDENAPAEVIRYQSLISLMLSSQTKDQVTFEAMKKLIARGCTINKILEISDEELGKLIYPVGFWKTKVKYIKTTTQILKDQYNGDIPDSVEKLCKLKGVGPKMAHICMKVAWNKVTGIGVDTHVHRISNRIGWVKKPTPNPEATRKSLESWLPFELWSEVNHLLVGFGQTICLPVGPLCYECLNRDICPSSSLGRKSPKKSPMKKEAREEVIDFKPKLSDLKSKNININIKQENNINIIEKHKPIKEEVSENKPIETKPIIKEKSPLKRKLNDKINKNEIKLKVNKNVPEETSTKTEGCKRSSRIKQKQI